MELSLGNGTFRSPATAVPGDQRGWEGGGVLTGAGGREAGGAGTWQSLREAVSVTRWGLCQGLGGVSVAPQTSSVKNTNTFIILFAFFSSVNSSNC